MGIVKELSEEQQLIFFDILKKRFEKNMYRHKDIEWNIVQKKLVENPQKLWSLHAMEYTEGAPDVVQLNAKSDEINFIDCSEESPKGRRSLCYDMQGWESRKDIKPENNAIDLAAEMGIEILNEHQYKSLQLIGNFDLKTSSWLKTPSNIRSLGGAIFGDFRYGSVFIYHNGAQSFYAARGFRGILKL